MMKRKRSSSKEAMERTEFSKDATRLLKEFQYLRTDRAFSCLCSVAFHQPPTCVPLLDQSLLAPVSGAGAWCELNSQLGCAAVSLLSARGNNKERGCWGQTLPPALPAADALG